MLGLAVALIPCKLFLLKSIDVNTVKFPKEAGIVPTQL